MLKIGLVLSGGMAKGAFQIGALKAVQEFFSNDEIKIVTASSIGVLNGFAYLTDNLETGEKMWKNLLGNESKMYVTSVMKSKYLQDAIKELSKSSTKLDKTFYISIYYAKEMQLRYVLLTNEKKVDYQKYLQASVALPITNKAIELDGHKLYDGAMIDNIPVKPFIGEDIDIIICFYFDTSHFIFENEEIDSRIIKIQFKTDTLMKDSLFFEKEKIESMIKIGHSFTMAKLEHFFSDGKENLEAIKEKIKTDNLNYEREKRVTCEILMTMINKVGKKIIKLEKQQLK